jgi:hypothetical protein
VDKTEFFYRPLTGAAALPTWTCKAGFVHGLHTLFTFCSRDGFVDATEGQKQMLFRQVRWFCALKNFGFSLTVFSICDAAFRGGRLYSYGQLCARKVWVDTMSYLYAIFCSNKVSL